MEFSKNGNSIFLEKDLNECKDLFIRRGWFIISQNNINNLEELNKYSKLWINIKFKGCKYSNHIHKIIYSMEKNLSCLI